MAFSTEDEELVDCLKRKVDGRDLPSRYNFHEVDFWEYHPKELKERYPPSADGCWYFFTPIYYKDFDSRTRRNAGEGVWICTAKNQYVNNPDEKLRRFNKAPFTYFEEGRTDWMMVEYRIPECLQLASLETREEWGLCKLF